MRGRASHSELENGRRSTLSGTANGDLDAATWHIPAPSPDPTICGYLQPHKFPAEFLVEAGGLEPPTFALRNRRHCAEVGRRLEPVRERRIAGESGSERRGAEESAGFGADRGGANSSPRAGESG